MIGIVYVGDLKYCPYLDKYLDVLKELNKSYEVLFWNRENAKVIYPQNYLSFDLKSKIGRSPVSKIFDFIQFRKWLKNIIAEKKYDRLIVLSTLSGMLMASTLLKKYKNKYIFDIRDYSYERYKLFYRLEEKIIKNSKFTCISSEGFKNFLPINFEYITANNFSYSDLKHQKNFIKKEKGSTINIVWMGVVRYFEHQSEILKRLKNDKRFNLIYNGSGPDLKKLQMFCKDNQIVNVSFTGSYENSSKSSLLSDADILNNSYGIKNDDKVKHAIANRYYDGLIYGIPQLVEINTFKHKKVKESGVGIGIDIYSENFADILYDYYFGLDENQFNENCEIALTNIFKEDELYISKIKEFVVS